MSDPSYLIILNFRFWESYLFQYLKLSWKKVRFKRKTSILCNQCKYWGCVHSNKNSILYCRNMIISSTETFENREKRREREQPISIEHIRQVNLGKKRNHPISNSNFGFDWKIWKVYFTTTCRIVQWVPDKCSSLFIRTYKYIYFFLEQIILKMINYWVKRLMFPDFPLWYKISYELKLSHTRF